MPITIRQMTDTDLEGADAILKLAFHSSVSRVNDLQLYRQMQMDGWCVALQGERLVGTVGAVNYGVFAHVGLMAVHPDFQRQGIGLALMQFLLARLAQQQVPLVTLDASKMGRPLYTRLGFIPIGETLVLQSRGIFSKQERPSRPQPFTAQNLDEVVQSDTAVFGANRRKVLQTLLDFYPGRAFLQRDENGKLAGYLIAQNNRIGPWVMLQSRYLEELLQTALSLTYEETLSVSVPDANHEAIQLLQRYDFELVRSNQHMVIGVGELPGQRQMICAQTSLAAG